MLDGLISTDILSNVTTPAQNKSKTENKNGDFARVFDSHKETIKIKETAKNIKTEKVNYKTKNSKDKKLESEKNEKPEQNLNEKDNFIDLKLEKKVKKTKLEFKELKSESNEEDEGKIVFLEEKVEDLKLKSLKNKEEKITLKDVEKVPAKLIPLKKRIAKKELKLEDRKDLAFASLKKEKPLELEIKKGLSFKELESLSKLKNKGSKKLESLASAKDVKTKKPIKKEIKIEVEIVKPLIKDNKKDIKTTKKSIDKNFFASDEKKGIKSTGQAEIVPATLFKKSDSEFKKLESKDKLKLKSVSLKGKEKLDIKKSIEAKVENKIMKNDLYQKEADSDELIQANKDGNLKLETKNFENTLANSLRSNLRGGETNSSIVRNAKMIFKSANQGEIRLVLKPESLGTVRINLQINDGKVSGHLIANTIVARDVMQENLFALENAFRNEGMEVANFDLSFGQKQNKDNTREESEDHRKNDELVNAEFSLDREMINDDSQVDLIV